MEFITDLFKITDIFVKSYPERSGQCKQLKRIRRALQIILRTDYDTTKPFGVFIHREFKQRNISYERLKDATKKCPMNVDVGNFLQQKKKYMKTYRKLMDYCLDDVCGSFL